MALNFPSNTSLPYVDASSGLKYIFNSSIGAWESAIQPPAIVSSYPPTDVQIPGFLYWDKEDGNLYIYYKEDGESDGQWVQASPNPEIPRAFVSSTPPLNPVVGDLWWDTVSGELLIWYDDGDSSQWVDTSPSTTNQNNQNQAGVSVSNVPPGNPVVGALWWNTTDGNLYIWYGDSDGGSSWVNASSALGISSSGGSGTITSIIIAPAPNSPILVTGTVSRPLIGIKLASTTETGVMRFANTSETNSGNSTSTALSPGGLKAGISNYVPNASTTVHGIVELGTQGEINAGAADRVVTGETLANYNGFGGVPPGVVMEWYTNTAPTGWVPCDGRSTAGLPNLEILFGVGNNIPDLRGQFTRGWSPGRVVNSYQDHQIPRHTHTAFASRLGSWTFNSTNAPNGPLWASRFQGPSGSGINTEFAAGPIFVNATTSGVNPGPPVGEENRPRNVACMKIMKT